MILTICNFYNNYEKSCLFPFIIFFSIKPGLLPNGLTRARGEQVIVQRVSRDHSGIRLVLKTRFFCERNNLILQYYPWGFTSIHSIAGLYRQKYNFVFEIFYFKIRNFNTFYIAIIVNRILPILLMKIWQTTFWKSQDFEISNSIFLCEKLLWKKEIRSSIG